MYEIFLENHIEVILLESIECVACIWPDSYTFQLDTLLTMVAGKTNETDLKMFDPRSALFIFNKCDKLSEQEMIETKDRVLERIRLKWPDLDEAKQVHYLSILSVSNPDFKYFYDTVCTP